MRSFKILSKCGSRARRPKINPACDDPWPGLQPPAEPHEAAVAHQGVVADLEPGQAEQVVQGSFLQGLDPVVRQLELLQLEEALQAGFGYPFKLVPEKRRAVFNILRI